MVLTKGYQNISFVAPTWTRKESKLSKEQQTM